MGPFVSRPVAIGKSAALVALASLTACLGSGPGLSTPQTAQVQLNSPNPFVLSGALTSSVGGINFLFANYAGNVNNLGNNVAVTFNDLALPLTVLSSNAFAAQGSVSCTMGTMLTTIAPTGSELDTQVAATACTDQELIAVTLDETQIQDAAGNTGSGAPSVAYTVDLAPVVTTAAMGNNSGIPGYYKSTGPHPDQFVIVVFSKNMAGGNLIPSVTGCSATIASANVLVSDPSNETVIWALSSVIPTQTCTLNLSNVSDFAGNPDDPSDPYLSMALQIQ